MCQALCESNLNSMSTRAPTKVHGLFIGINRYLDPEINELSCSVRDAQALYALFSDSFNDKQFVLLTDTSATKEAIRNEFVTRLHRVSEDDFVVIAFSGHGSDDHFIIPFDAKGDDRNSAISHDDLLDWFSRIPAKNVFLILDCCFSGGAGAKVFHRPTKERMAKAAEPLIAVLGGKGRLIIAASSPDEPAWEDHRKRHGLLTYFLIQCLQGAPEVVSGGMIPIFKSLEFIVRSVSSAALAFSEKQTPAIRGALDGEMLLPVLKPARIWARMFPDDTHCVATENPASLAAAGFSAGIIKILAKEFPTLNALQIEAINEFGVLRGNSLVACAPTSSGKTFIGELAALKAFMDGKRTLFLLPMRALVNDKHQEFNRRYGDYGLRVIRATGEITDDNPQLMRGRYDICLMTTEKFTSLVLSNPHLLHQVGTIVVDELQLIVDEGRGMNLEFALTLLKARRAVGIEPQIICLSGVVGDTNGFEGWLGGRLLRHAERPVPLQEGTIGYQGLFEFVTDEGEEGNEMIIPPPSAVKGSAQDVIIPLVRELAASNEKIIVFRETQGETMGCAAYLADSCGLPPAQEAIDALPEGDRSLSSARLHKALTGGVAFHNSSLDRAEREIIERVFRDPKSSLKVVVSTTTLAMGVNTPASSVVIEGLMHPQNKPYTVAEYKNMVGRAGRMGFAETGKSFLIAQTPAAKDQFWTLYVRANPEPITSRFNDEDVLSLITRVLATASKMAEPDLIAFLGNTFGAFLNGTRAPGWDGEYARKIRAALAELVAADMVKDSDGCFVLTPLGRLSGESGIKVQSVISVVKMLRDIPVAQISDLALVCAAQATRELDDLRIPMNAKSHQERQRWPRTLEDLGLGTFAGRLSDSAEDDRMTTQRCKKAVAVIRWISGTPLSAIEDELQQHYFQKEVSGAIRQVASRTGDVVPMVCRIVELMNGGADTSKIGETLLARLQFGVPEEIVPLVAALKDKLGRASYLALFKAGIHAPESASSAGRDRMSEVLGSKTLAEGVIALVQAS